MTATKKSDHSLRILFISPYIPSLIRVRPYNFIKYLAQLGHQITLLALVPPGEEAGSLDTLRRWCHHVQTIPLPGWRTLWNGLLAIPGKTPFQAAYSWSPEMENLIRLTQTKETFDVVHVEHLRGAELGRTLNNIPVVFDSVDSITLLFEHVKQSAPTKGSLFKAWLDLSRTRHYESRLLEQFDRLLITSAQDKKALVDMSTINSSDDRIIVLPNGVDLDYFSPVDVPRDPATLVFTGKMSYHANIAAVMDLATQVMPLVWQQLPDVKLVIAGKDPTETIKALGADSRITVTGFVPDLPPYLARATVSVLPMRYGVGIQNKVLEAMAMGTPVITTPQTLASLQVKSGQEIIAADTPRSISQAVVNLLTDDDFRRKIGQAGRSYVEAHHNWHHAANKLTSVYKEVIAEKRVKNKRNG